MSSSRVYPQTNISAPGLDPLPAGGPEPPPPLPVTVRIAGTLDGAEVELEVEIPVRHLGKLVGRLRERGFEPRRPALTFSFTPDGEPICPRHGVPMARREKQGDVWHNHKVIGPGGEELYCRGYPGHLSPGYAVPVDPSTP